MSLSADPRLSERIRARAAVCGLALEDAAASALAVHARLVLQGSPELHLTSITDADEFIERHLGEAFEGAAMLPADVRGSLLDLGSGNGYPGLPIAAALPGLRPFLAEASLRKAAFLRSAIREAGVGAEVLEAQVQRPADLESVPPLRVLVTRAMGAWPKVLPRLVSCLDAGGDVLVWAGDEMEPIARRAVWRRLLLLERKPLPGRERSFIWRFGPSGPG